VGDAELVRGARAGEEAAWDTIIRTHQEAMFRLAYLLLGDVHDAQDVAQDALVRGFRALDSFDLSRPLRPWLLRITSNLAHNRLRSVRRYLRAWRRLAQAEPARVTDLGERSGQQWEAQTLWQALRQLNRAEQEVVYLRYFLELSEAEMATILAVAPGTVKSRLHRALQRLRAIVDGEFPALRVERQE
jgi:RNA polymerase sigma-70 factor (ECF subfamily)